MGMFSKYIVKRMLLLLSCRAGDHGVFRHAFFYRLISPVVATPPVSYKSAHHPGFTATAPGLLVNEPMPIAQEVLDLSSIHDGDNGSKDIEPAARPRPEVFDLSKHCDDSAGNTTRGAGGQPHGSEERRRTEKRKACGAEGTRGDGTWVDDGVGRGGDSISCGGTTTKCTRGPASVFSAQPLLPGAEAAVMRAHEKEGRCKLDAVIEGYGGGTVGDQGRGIGSALI